MKQKTPPVEDLRSRAEEAVESGEDSSIEWSGEDMRRLIHELRIHQVELELQNEELRNAQALIEESRMRYADLYDFAPVGYFTFDEQGRIVEVNLAGAKQLGFERANLIKMPFVAMVIESDRKGFYSYLRKVFDTHEGDTCEVRLKAREGGALYARLDSIFMESADGTGSCRTSVTDISGKKRAEEILKESEEKFRLAFQTSPDAINLNRFSDGTYIDINEGFTKTTGYAREDAIGKTSLELNIWHDPEDRARLVTALKSTGLVENMEAKFCGKDGRIIIGLMSARLLRISREDVILSITRDITGLKAVEEEKNKLETQLFHAQKLESVGRLAGGVAHDFNNMLGVILGHTELALDQADPADPLYHDLQEIRKATHRSANLTRQLLAFARRQNVSPKVLDLNETISAMLIMLWRLVGEDIDLIWKPSQDPWKVKIDPSQVDQILANLTLNARDAIQGNGSITISTENVVLDKAYGASQEGFVAGQYVLLRMSDSGSGMDRDVLDHVFEPFFTTKGLGRGTGLGLATVYGIVRQNNGFIMVSSTPGKGTTFQIYLPGLEATATGAPPGELAEKVPGGSETILVVEDDGGMLNLSKAMLEGLGYKVYTASIPTQAILIAEEHAEIELVISDVVMPEMNGRELVERLRSTRPNLKFIYMSGYTADVIARRGVLEDGIHFVQKPFSIKTIAKKVREALED